MLAKVVSTSSKYNYQIEIEGCQEITKSDE